MPAPQPAPAPEPPAAAAAPAGADPLLGAAAADAAAPPRGLAGAVHRGVAYALLPTIVLVVAAEVVARYVFRAPLRWSEEVVSLTLLIAFVGSIPVGVARDAHIRVESLYERFGAPMRRAADALGALCGAIFLGMLALGAGREALGMLRRGDGTEHLGVPHWPLAVLVALIAGATALWLLVRVVARGRDDGGRA
ncbi:MAG: TRAP transporter small permease [Burkholderiales bacterium]|nr:TRAP transporter small permease [Burkholderiales bacterium]